MSDYIPNPQNLTDKAQTRIIWQYRNGPKFKQWVSILPTIGERDVGRAANDVASLINLDTATGEALNICGRIANIERPVIPEPQLDDIFYLTSLTDDPPQLGDEDVQMVSLESAIPVDLQDYLYRRLIRAKISTNNTNVTIDDLARVLAFAAGIDTEAVGIIDYQDMTFSVVFGVELDEITRYVFSNYPLVPRPQGVKLLGYVEQPLFMQMNEAGDFSMGDDLAQLGDLEEVFA